MTHPVAVVAVATVAALLAAGGVLSLGATNPVASAAPNAAIGTRILKGPDGHFWAKAEVGGRSVRLLVDTGATAVSLTRADAERLGIDTRNLVYNRRVTTAMGSTRAARVTLADVSVGGAEVDEVSALVLERGLPTSLLGMSYLGRLQGFSADRESLTLRP